MTSSTLPIAVRVIEYELPGALEPEPLYRLITTLMDEKEITAQTLAKLYRERWTIETTLAETKATFEGSSIVLRSKTPDLVRQEFYGLVIAHYAIRQLMQEASLGVLALSGKELSQAVEGTTLKEIGHDTKD